MTPKAVHVVVIILMTTTCWAWRQSPRLSRI